MNWSPESPEPGSTPSGHRILGVDPGTRITGWGLVGGTPGNPTWLDAGVIRLGAPEDDLALRLHRLREQVEKIVDRVQPTCSAVESPFHGANARSALQLAHSRGVVLAVLASAGLDVHEYTPATVKKAVTGNGRAPKEQVRRMVECLLRHPGPASTDQSDALAVALCHAGSRRQRELVRR